MQKLQKSSTVQLDLSNIMVVSPGLKSHISQQIIKQSPKPPLGSKCQKSPKGDSSFRVVSPKTSNFPQPSMRSRSKGESSFKKQCSLKLTNYEDSQNDAIIEDNYVQQQKDEDHESNSKTQSLTQIKDELDSIGGQISSTKLLDINMNVLKSWQSELLQQTQSLIIITQKLTDQFISRHSPRIISQLPEKKIENNELQEKLVNEKKNRLAAEEQCSKLLQAQEQQITQLNEKLFLLEQNYAKINK